MTFSALVHLRNNDHDDLDDERSDARPKRGDIFDVRTRTAQYGVRESLRRWLEDGRDRDDFDARFFIIRVSSGSVPADEACVNFFYTFAHFSFPIVTSLYQYNNIKCYYYTSSTALLINSSLISM